MARILTTEEMSQFSNLRWAKLRSWTQMRGITNPIGRHISSDCTKWAMLKQRTLPWEHQRKLQTSEWLHQLIEAQLRDKNGGTTNSDQRKSEWRHYTMRNVDVTNWLILILSYNRKYLHWERGRYKLRLQPDENYWLSTCVTTLATE